MAATAPRRVVVTGLGMVTGIGLNVEESWKAAVEGVSGADTLTQFAHGTFPVHFGVEVKGFKASDWMDGKEARRNDRFVHLGMAAARQAMADAKLDVKAANIDPNRCGVVVGSGIGGIHSIEEQMLRFVERGASRISPFTVPMLMVNGISGVIAIEFGFKGVNYSPVSACATGNHALALGLRHIRWGDADVVLCGGSEAGISILGLGGFSNMKALSTRNEDPKRASRPFDKERDGFVIGEGAGVLLLEELEHARRRGAVIHGEVLGAGMTDDAYHITAPEESGDGGTRGMVLAIAEAGLAPEQIDYVNCHGTSTPYNDKTETLCIKKSLGEAHARRIVMSSTKGQIGHTLGAAGGIEAIFTLLTIKTGIIPPTINYQTPDPDCDLNYCPNQAGKADVRYALSNNLGFGGHNVTICLGRYDGRG